MLKHLYIKNYALIEELDIEMHRGFSVITGETGAGKSIMLGAIGLLLGQRADSKVIQEGAQRCIIEAEFNLRDYHLESFFEQNDIDYNEDECILRRELTSTGKSRAFINDTPATVAQMKELGEHLIDIHSQHQNLLLGTEDFQLNVLDILAKDQMELEKYRRLYNAYRNLQQELEDTIEQSRKSAEEQDYLNYQYQQLEELNPQPGEDETLQQESDLLSHAEEIKSTLFQTESFLSSEDTGILKTLRQAYQQMQNLARLYPPAEEFSERLESSYIELKDIAGEVSDQGESIEYDPERLQQINERLDILYSIEQKHHVSNSDELIRIREELSRRLEAINNSDEMINQLRLKLSMAQEEVEKQANRLSQLRKNAAKIVEKDMQEKLIPLGIPNAYFHIVIEQTELKANGQDHVTYFFNANKNSTPQPIAQVASGGEISRIMLCLKSLISGVSNLPTIIFDEIDTGVSGRIAECMAQIMKEMSQKESRQVISITHLPQIAALGTSHYRVYKEDTKKKTLSHIIELNPSQRVEEIAHMLSGAQVTEAAIENAKQLLK
ncbi:MAG: DNA repair protein RecN [Bacteroidaceae bacterium]|nr:DNA repair protein RecN [Bacteroidaceae bacterium]